jgi:hypothetical protein
LNKNKKDYFQTNTYSLSLGSGDIFAIIALASACFFSFGPGAYFAVCFGAIFVLYFLLNFVLKYNLILPALPPLILGSSIGLFLYLLVF